MLNLVLFGAPGSGKGTQAGKLSEKYHLLHISTGDIFRNEIKNKTALGTEAKKYIDAGILVPDMLTIGMLGNFIDRNLSHQYKGIIFDGFPRTIPQANAFDDYLKQKHMPITRVLALNVNEEELVRRILQRGKSSGRSDDTNEETIRHRLRVYVEQTAPLVQYFLQQHKFVSIFGEGDIDEIFRHLSTEVDKLI
jgi:adenylate kinase